MRKWIIIGLCLAAYIVLGIADNVPAGEIMGDGALSLFLIAVLKPLPLVVDREGCLTG
jgi:hypothetical protein